MTNCKKLLAIIVALVMLVSTLVSGLVVSAANPLGTLTVTGTTVDEGKDATVTFNLDLGENSVDALHMFVTIASDVAITDAEIGEVAYVSTEDFPAEDEELLDGTDPRLEISTKELAQGKLLFESGVATVAKVTDVEFTVTFATAELDAGDYDFNVTVDATDYDEADYDVITLESAITVCGAEEPKPEVPAITYTFGHTMQIKAIEPWGLFFNAAIRQNGVTVDYSTLSDYGMYILRADTQPESVEELINSADTKVFKKGDENVTIDNTSNRVKVTYDYSLYTYEMENKYYAVFYATDPNGNVSYGDIKERSMRSVINQYLNAPSDYSEELITLCNKLVNMYEYTVAYKEAHPGTADRYETTPNLLGDCTFGEASTDVAYKFGHTMQMTTIEPWGLLFNGICRLNNVAIDYSKCSEYGAIIYTDTNGKYNDAAPTNAQLLSEDAALVYNNLNNSVSLSSDGKIVIDYTEGIYTYQMEQNLYAMYYVVIDGKYYYGDVKTRSMMSVANQYFASSSYGQDLIDLLEAMVDLYEATIDYRASV